MGSRKEVASPSSASSSSSSSGSQDAAISGRPALCLFLLVNLFVEFGDCDLDSSSWNCFFFFFFFFCRFSGVFFWGNFVKWFFHRV